MYSDQITNREKQLGYYVAQMPNPKGRCLFQKKRVQAVMYQLDKNNVVVKVALPSPKEGYRYSHQQWDNGRWQPVQNGEFDPEAALWKANTFMEQQVEPGARCRSMPAVSAHAKVI
jgi:hypothetical protein